MHRGHFEPTFFEAFSFSCLCGSPSPHTFKPSPNSHLEIKIPILNQHIFPFLSKWPHQGKRYTSIVRTIGVFRFPSIYYRCVRSRFSLLRLCWKSVSNMSNPVLYNFQTSVLFRDQSIICVVLKILASQDWVNFITVLPRPITHQPFFALHDKLTRKFVKALSLPKCTVYIIETYSSIFV